MINRISRTEYLNRPGHLKWQYFIMGIALSASVLGAQENSVAIEKQTKIHRLNNARRAPLDAFVYVNRIPGTAEEDESPSDFAGRIFGRLANQEGRVLLKLPSGMDRKAYLGFKTFLGSESNDQVQNCVACHAPADFTDLKSHVTTQGGSARVTPSLRNLKRRNVDLEKAILTKIAASRMKRSGLADEIDDAYAAMTITEADVPNLVAFLNSLNEVTDSEFRNLIINATVLDTTVDIESTPIVSGVVRFEGPRPKRKPLQLNADSRKLYETVPLDERVLINENGEISNVFVYVKRGVEKKDFPLPAEPALMNQDRSMFRPRVQGVHVGQEFLTRNSDPFIHNVRSLSIKNRAFNIAQPANTPDRKRIFKKQEGPIQLKCDFHPWMTAFIFVMEHPFFAVTDEQGRFHIEGLPVGDYTLEAWHEEFGVQRQKMTVDRSGSEELNFTFKPKDN